MICPKCQGERRIWSIEFDEEQECPVCGGTGEVNSEDYEDL